MSNIGNYDDEQYLKAIGEELEFLRRNNLVEIIGINESGEWLYSVTGKAREAMDKGGDFRLALSELLDKAEENENNQ